MKYRITQINVDGAWVKISYASTDITPGITGMWVIPQATYIKLASTFYVGKEGEVVFEDKNSKTLVITNTIT